MLRGDGKLNLDIAVSDDGKAPQDQCGVFGVWAPGEEVAKLAFFGLYSLQHRGQESAGIATSDGKKILVYKDMGLVSQVFSESALESLIGHIAVGHNRYSTTGASHWRNAQPTLGRTSAGTVALAHNGNLTNTADLLDLLKRSREDAEAKLQQEGFAYLKLRDYQENAIRAVEQALAKYQLVEDHWLQGPWVFGDGFTLADGYLAVFTRWARSAHLLDLARQIRAVAKT